MENTDFNQRTNLDELQDKANQIISSISAVVLGQESVIRKLLIGILSNGHILLEGVPGVAKTLLIKLFARAIDAKYSRIQFTSDLMPSDIIGTSIFNRKISEFEFKKGAIFANIILADEINRAPAKTQSALFEAMEERQITYDGKLYIPGNPFLVFATQNPIEYEGTYRLPEAQLDRFLFKIKVDYPSLEVEENILNKAHARKGTKEIDLVQPIISTDEIIRFHQIVEGIFADEKLINYIAQIVHATRNNHSLYLGASPRASLGILIASKAVAALSGRDFITPDDIKEVAFPILSHRLILSPEKEIQGLTTTDIIKQIISKIEIPR